MFALTAMLLSFVSVNAQEGIVAKIGNSEYTTFANAMTDANAATGNVTVEVYGAVEFVDGMELNGSYTAITFTGMSAGAKITINQTAGGDYLTAHGKTVAFNGLILAKANPAWSGNSGHMGNYFSIQGGTVTYTYCTFPNGACTSTGTAVYNNCTFQNASEYGLWVYDDALVTVNGGTIDSTKGIKVYSEGEDSVTSTLTVQNATFTENVTAKPAVAIGYAESITLIGNTYNNPTAHVELDSGSDADCDGIAFVAKDSEGNDIASTLEMTDRSNSSAPCGVLVDGKIYTTVTTAAAEATSGSTVTLLYNTTETVELPEGVTLDTNDFTADNVTVEVSLAGEGTEASPYLINSVADLETLRNKVNAGNSYAGQFVKLAADLTLTEAWTPIGNGTRSSKSYSGNAFKGTFDGGNKTISGLKITSTTGSDAAIGLFGVVDGGTVKNLTLNNVDINVANSNLAGGAIGLMLGGATAENITVNGAIVGNDGVGGIVGRLVINGTIKDCTNNASVTSSYGGIGGIVGKAYYEDGANTTIFASIDNCTNNGTVTAPMYVGGIVGLARANVTDCVNNGPVVGGTQTGGIIGQLIAAGTVSGNENKAKITGKNHLGGIIGDYSQSSAYTYNNVAITSNINRGELAATEQCAAIMGCNNIDGFTAMTATGNLSYYFVEGLELFGNPEDMVIDATNKFMLPVAKIGDVEYDTLAEAVAAAQAGDEIVLLGDVAEDATLPAGVKFNGNGKTVGNLTAGGEITFTGVTKAVSFSVQNTNTTVNIVAGACLEITGTNRMVIGHGCTFNITGNIENAKTADVAALTPSLIIPGASFTGAGVTFNVTNAYISAPSSYSSSSKSANGTFDFNFTNSIWESAGKLAFESQSTAATVNFDLVNSVLNTGSHLVFGVSRGEVVIDNSNVNVGTTRQIENQSTMTIKNGSVVNGAVATSSNAKNPGTIIVENATYAVTGEFSGSDLGTGTLIVKKGATVSAGSITKANIQIDATGMAAGDEVNLTANLSNLEGSLTVVNNNLDASIVDGKIVLAVKPAAKIGETKYATLDEAFGAATEGETITLLADATPVLKSQSAITKAAVIDLGGNTLTLTEDDLYFGTTTFKNGTIVVDPSVYANTAVFWMFANQTLTFDNVDIIATGLTGTYLIGINDGTGSSVNLLNGSSITIDNSEKAELSTVIADNGNGNSVIIKDSKIDVKNVDARLYLGGQNGSVTIENSDIVLNGVKEGFYLRAGQTLAINGTSKVDITLNADTKPRYGINMTDATATYTKAETATVNATVYAPATGSNSLAYTKEENGYVRVWGEGGGNAKESYELKLYSGETLIATTKLNNVGNIIDGDVYVTWNFYYPQSTDEYWTTTWEAGHPNSAAQPTEVELYIDGTLVATTAAKMSGADDVNPVVWRDLGGVAIADLLGEGTAENPYLIETLKDLKFFRDDVNAGNTYAGKTVKVVNNIDLAGENWTPIGNITYDSKYKPTDASKVFSGVFNGNGKVISNLKVESTVGGADTPANVGLFGITGEGAVIKDLTLTNVNINTDGRNVGAIAGFAYKATLKNITVNGNIQIEGGNNVAGIAGMTRYYDMSATDITVSGANGSAIVGNNIVGGIFAEIAPNGSVQEFKGLNVENVAVTGVGGVGGIVGLLTTGAVENVSVKDVVLTGRTDYQGNAMGRIRLGSVAGLMGGKYATIANETVENVTAKNLDGNAVELPVIGANYDAASNATEAKIGNTYYNTLLTALGAAKENETIVLISNIDTTEAINILAGKKLVLDLNGKTITGTDNATASYGLININSGAELTINDTTGNGAIKLTATNDRDWNAYSSVISNQRGKLVVNGGTIEHLGGTDMAYGVDNLTNGQGTYAETIINGGTIKSTYRAIRQFLNGTEAQNILTINGGTIEGANKSVWMQDPSKNANTGTLTIAEDAKLVGDVYLYVTPESTSWPVEVSIAAAALQGESKVMTGNVPAGYELAVVDGTYGVYTGAAKIGTVYYATIAEAINAALAGETVVILAGEHAEGTIKLPATLKNVTFKGVEGAVLKDMTIMAHDGNTINYEGLTFDGIVFENSRIAITGWRNGDVAVKDFTVKNCTFKNLNDTSNSAPLHFNMDADEAVNGLTFTNNVIDGATGGSKSGIYAQVTGKTVFSNNVINNVAFRPYVVQLTTNDGVADEFVVTGNTFSGSAAGRAQGLGNSAEGTDAVKLVVSNNIFKDITDAQQICYWNFNEATTEAVLEKNYYDINIIEKANRFYFNSAAQDASDLVAMGIFPYYTELNADGTINEESLTVVPVAVTANTGYATVTEAIKAAADGATVEILAGEHDEVIAPWAGDTQHTSEKSITIVGSKNFGTTLTGGMYLGYDDSQCREHNIVVKGIVFKGKGLKVACQQNVTIEGNKFADITEGQAIAVVGKNINSVVKNNVIENVAAAQGIELRNTLTATVEGNTISGTAHNSLQITSQVGATNSSVTVKDNTMSNWGTAGEGRAMRINNIVTADINGNVMSHTGAPEEFVKVTGSTTLNAAANYWNGVSPLTAGMFTGVEGDPIAALQSYYTDSAKSNLVTFTTTESAAIINGSYYETLAAAVTAVKDGETITLLKTCSENVTINQVKTKSFTIDGNNNTYTGTITVQGDGTTNNTPTETLTFRNINFELVGAKYAITSVKGKYARNITVENCSFKGENSYGIRVRNGYNYTLKNVTVDGFYSFFNATESLSGLTVENVTVTNTGSAFNFSYATGIASLKNVNIDVTGNGIWFQNRNASTVTLENCSIKAATPINIVEAVTNTNNFVFNGTNNFTATNGENWLVINDNAEFNATFNVTVNDANLDIAKTSGFVAYAKNSERSFGSNKFLNVTSAMADGDVVTLVADVALTTANYVTITDNYATLCAVKEQNVTIDLNGKVITVNASAADVAGAESGMLFAVFAVDTNGNLTITDSSNGAGAVNVVANDAPVYCLAGVYGNGGKLTIENGSYTADMLSNCLIYAQHENCVTVNNGNYHLGNVGTGANGSPWIFNTYGKNVTGATVNGGTFNTDINHTFWANEVFVPETLALRNNGDGTWTVVPAVAYAVEIATSTGSSDRNIGYATVAEAVEGVKNGGTVTLLSDVALENGLTVEAGRKFALDLNGKTVSMEDASAATVAMIKNYGNLTITDSSEEKAGKLSFNSTTPSAANAYASNVISNYGTITVEAGTIENTTVGSACYALDNYAGSTATINGGKLTAEKTTVRIFNWTNGDAAKATLNVNGGEIYSKDGYAINVNSGNAPSVALNITGGTITTDDTDYNLAVYVFNNGTAENFTANVTGGEFNGCFALNGATCETMAQNAVSISGGTFEGVICYGEPAYGFISGGVYNTPVDAAYCADGYAPYALENGKYGVEYLVVDEITIVDGSYDEFVNQNAKTVGTLTYERTLPQANVWQSLYVPFEIPVEELTGLGLDVAYIYDVHFDIVDGEPNLSKAPDVHLIKIKQGTLKANFPYVIRANSESALDLTIELENARLYSTDKEAMNSVESSSTITRFIFAGTYSKATRAGLTGSDDIPCYAVTKSGSWLKMGATAELSPFRIYLSLVAKDGSVLSVSDAAESIAMRVIGEENEDGTTSIYDVYENVDSNGMIFDLQGRRVLEPQKGGMYIIDGKKVIY